MIPDRRVHAETSHVEIVRYERQGKWWFESKDGKIRQLWSVADVAKSTAHWLAAGTGEHHKGLPGGRTFDRLVSHYLRVEKDG